MREIKFRGKAKNNISMDDGEWIYGYFRKWFNSSDGKEYGFISDGYANVWEVDLNTVSEYTGLKDENGKEIFENDICKNMLGIKGYIVFDIDKGGYCIENKEGFFKLSYHLEVLGNIYENPKLLNEKTR